MSNHKCHNCLFGDKCSSPNGCEYYCPIEEDESSLDEYIEERRIDFEEEWRKYLKEFE